MAKTTDSDLVTDEPLGSQDHSENAEGQPEPLPLTESSAQDQGQAPASDTPPAEPISLWKRARNLFQRSAVWAPVVAAVVLATVSVYSIFLQDEHYNGEAAPGDYQAAADFIRQNYKPGDIIRIEPHWLDDPRVYLSGLEIDPSSKPMGENLSTFDRVWVLAGYNRGDVVAMPSKGYELTLRQSFGRADLLLFQVPVASTPAYDFRAHLHEAQVFREPPNKKNRKACKWNELEKAFHCGRVDAWLYVAERYLDVDGEPRKCIFIPPLPEQHLHQLVYTKVPLTKRLHGRLGQDSRSIIGERGSDLTFEIFLNSKLVHTLVLPRRETKFLPFDVDTSAFEGKTAEIKFQISARDFFDHVPCFQVWLAK